jgi:hypothetical protein
MALTTKGRSGRLHPITFGRKEAPLLGFLRGIALATTALLGVVTEFAVLAGGSTSMRTAPASASLDGQKRDATTMRSGCQEISFEDVKYVFYRHRVNCEVAKDWARHVRRSHGDWEPRGFNCRSGSDFQTGGECHTPGRSRYFGYHPLD